MNKQKQSSKNKDGTKKTIASANQHQRTNGHHNALSTAEILEPLDYSSLSLQLSLAHSKLKEIESSLNLQEFYPTKKTTSNSTLTKSSSKHHQEHCLGNGKSSTKKTVQRTNTNTLGSTFER